MKRKGQIFLILTILVVSFMIGITTVLLDVQKADFLEPAPDSEIILESWDLTIKSITEIMDLQLVADPTAGAKDISQPISNLGDYLTTRGIANSITIPTGATVVIVGGGAAQSISVSISASFSVLLSSASTSISQTITIDINYTMDVQSPLTILQTVNGIQNYVAGASFNVGSVVDLGNGSYTHTEIPTVLITATLPNGLVLSATVP
ncbi:MAG: hypothetical protein ACXAE3_10355 [Candidatus Kariarchaeaceae archaeon]|jgi:hypothetical protein